jgi:phage/plasmid-associated DNA primase
LYAAFSRWCERNGERPMKHRQFGESMSERGFERYTNNGTWYKGVTTRNR